MVVDGREVPVVRLDLPPRRAGDVLRIDLAQHHPIDVLDPGSGERVDDRIDRSIEPLRIPVRIVVPGRDDDMFAEPFGVRGEPSLDVVGLELLDEAGRIAVDMDGPAGRERPGQRRLGPEPDRIGEHHDPLGCWFRLGVRCGIGLGNGNGIRNGLRPGLRAGDPPAGGVEQRVGGGAGEDAQTPVVADTGGDRVGEHSLRERVDVRRGRFGAASPRPEVSESHRGDDGDRSGDRPGRRGSDAARRSSGTGRGSGSIRRCRCAYRACGSVQPARTPTRRLPRTRRSGRS